MKTRLFFKVGHKKKNLIDSNLADELANELIYLIHFTEKENVDSMLFQILQYNYNIARFNNSIRHNENTIQIRQNPVTI